MAYDDAGSSPAGEGRRPSLTGRTGAGTAAISRGDDRPGPPPAAMRARTGAPAAPRTPVRPAALLGAGAAGIAAAVFGTLLHGHLVLVAGAALPVGAFAALVLAGSLFLLCGLWARNVVLTAVAGAVAYGVVALLSTSSKMLILTGSSDTAPGSALAGNVWLFGVLAVTLVAVAGSAVVLTPSRLRGRTAG